VSEKRASFFSGASDVGPILPGLVPFGAVVGVTMANAGYSSVQTIVASLFMFTGAGQLVVAELTAAGTVWIVIVSTALVVSLRLVMYSASLAPYVQQLPRRNRFILSAFLVDQPYALSVLKFSSDESVNRFWYYVGTAFPMWLTWQVSTVVGILFGTSIPEWIDIGFIIPLIFISILVPAIEDLISVVTAVAAGFLALAGSDLPFELGLLAGALGGIIVGAVVNYGVSE